jgi:cyclophilin family peptidyl-prolyl cis-trans isomerase
MMARRRLLVVAGAALSVLAAGSRVATQRVAAPLIVVETAKGRFAFDTFPGDAPLTVAHIASLVRKGFYNGQRIHRAVPGFVVQFGDPQTRDQAKREIWGRGHAASSGDPIGAAEITNKRRHVIGAVGVAHLGAPADADSQIYITLAPRSDLDGQYTVFGQVVEGEDVPAKLQVGDEIIRAYLRE